MANANTPMGLRPVRYLNGARWDGQVQRYLLPASAGTDYFIGDPVNLAGDAGAYPSFVNGIPTGGMPTITLGLAAGTCIGAIVGFEPDPARLDLVYRLASTARVALVCDDPNVIFEIQEIGTGTQLTSAEVGLNADFVAGTGSAITGLSGYLLTNTTEATTSTLNCKILRLVQREDCEGYGAYAKWEVLINNHSFRTGIAGV